MARIAIDGKKMNALRVAKSLGLEELAEASKVSSQTLADVEAGRRLHVLERTLFRVAKVLKVSPMVLRSDVKQEPESGVA